MLSITMSNDPLHTYLRTYRRRAGLSQGDLAFLSGALSGARVSRHECGDRVPSLETAIAYVIVLNADVLTLYAGLSDRVRQTVVRRARGLLRSMDRKPPSARRDKKIAVLRALSGEISNNK